MSRGRSPEPKPQKSRGSGCCLRPSRPSGVILPAPNGVAFIVGLSCLTAFDQDRATMAGTYSQGTVSLAVAGPKVPGLSVAAGWTDATAGKGEQSHRERITGPGGAQACGGGGHDVRWQRSQ